MKYFSILILLITTSLFPSCNNNELPLEREEEYSDKTSGQRTPKRKDSELPVKDGIFDEKEEKPLELDE